MNLGQVLAQIQPETFHFYHFGVCDPLGKLSSSIRQPRNERSAGQNLCQNLDQSQDQGQNVCKTDPWSQSRRFPRLGDVTFKADSWFGRLQSVPNFYGKFRLLKVLCTKQIFCQFFYPQLFSL